MWGSDVSIKLVHVPHRWTWKLGASPLSGSARCGRPRVGGKSKGPCKAKPMYGIAACGSHATYVERSRAIRLLREQSPPAGQSADWDDTSGISPYPACWSWPVSVEIRQQASDGELGVLFDWQDLRCAACGHRPSQLVEDHDHDTGLVRGWLCQSCNLREPGASPGSSHPIDRRMVRYRRWNPARILDVLDRYSHPLWGPDYGKWHGCTIHEPVPISPDGVVQFELFNPDRSPVHVVSRALLGGNK